MSSSASIEQARTLADFGARLEALERTPQISRSTLDVGDGPVKVPTLIEAGVEAGKAIPGLEDGIEAAQRSADGKNSVTYSASAPSNTATPGDAPGDVWFVVAANTTGIITGQYEWTGTAWEQRTLGSSVIANIDAGKITTGTLDGITITGVTITGATIRTRASGQRTELRDNGLTFYDEQDRSAGSMFGVSNGAAGGLVRLGSGTGAALFGAQALPFGGTFDFTAPVSYLPEVHLATVTDYATGTPLPFGKERLRADGLFNSGGGILNPGASTSGPSLVSITIPQNVRARVRASAFAYFYLGTNGANFAGNLVLLIDSTLSGQNVRYHNQGHAGALTPAGTWNVDLGPGVHTLRLQVRVDGGSAAHEIWNFGGSISVEW